MSKALSSGVAQAVQIYSRGTIAWVEDEDEAWVSASVVSKEESGTGIKIVLENEQGRQHTFESSFALLEKLKGDNLPPLKNPSRLDNIDDLTNLNYLNEPSVLHTIRTRYFERNIYTYSGIVLIAMNPFFNVQLYEPEIIQMYSGKRRGDLEPHLFAIAEDAYRCMIRENTNQTVVVSGESGAGKTVSATHIMRYFATADDKESGNIKNKGMTEVEQQIMATNPIMEAFGNAKTTRNNNSSRFGKYIEIQFDKKHSIVGAKIRTYLLERSRLVFQPETERNYHIFYQLCSGNQAQEFGINDWEDFHYLNQSGIGTIPGVDDAKEFDLTQQSLSMVGISTESQKEIFSILAALLHIGNIEIGGRTDATVSDSQPSLQTATKLLGIKTADFKKWLLKRQIVTRNDKIIKNLNPTQSTVIRDSVAKYIYASLFDWLVKVINDSLSCKQANTVRTFIGVLDIYGFEHFKKNSFEQFCINYANEKLQQQFNQHVFKLEQEEYIKEKIDWKFIDFSDNQTCIEIIESKLGILSLLDEEARMPSGSDQGFCNKLFSSFTNPKYKDYFKKPRFSNSSFIVCHYAHDVEYDSEGFLDKNKDTVPDEILTLLQQANCKFLVDMLQVATEAATQEVKAAPVKKVGMAVNKKPTLGSIFKLSLIRLMETINSTNVHYIRCIKPNEAKVAWGFEPQMVLSQLRACGVLETIRISCAGYPSRWAFADFCDRFYILANSQYWNPKQPAEINKLCRMILDTLIKDTDKYQIGLTKIFFRAGQLAFLEKCRRERLDNCAIAIQKHIKRYLVRRDYLRTLDLISRLQRVAKQKMGARKLEIARQNIAATKIQAEWRRYIQRKRYLRQCAFIIRLQAASKAYITRKSFAHIRRYFAAVKIQSLVRGWIKRKQMLVKLQATVQRKQQEAKARQFENESRYNQRQEPPREVKREIQPRVNNIQNDPLEHIKKQDLEIVRLNEDLARQKEEISRLRINGSSSSYHSGDAFVNDQDVALLKSEIMALKAQLSQTLKNYPKRNSSIAAYRKLTTGSAVPNGYHNNPRIAFAEPGQMVPRHLNSKNVKSVEQEMGALLKNTDAVETEVIDGLVRSLKYIPPELQKLPAREEVVFPVHIVGECAMQLWRLGNMMKAERLLIRFADTVQKYCSSFTAEDSIVPCSYWLSNAHELLSLITCFEQELESEMRYSQKWQDYERSIQKVKQELEGLQTHIYCHYLSELKKVFSKLAIPAVIESQSLPGFMTGESNRFFGHSDSSSIDDVLNLLNRIHRTLKSYHVKNFVIEQVFTEVLKLVGVVAFNNLIKRTNFNSWKRAMQIQYNTTQLEEWCKTHNVVEAANKLEQIVQATKVLQLKKVTMEDVQIIREVCWALNPTQIQKLIQSYSIADYEEPISNEIIRAAASNARHTDTVLLDQVSIEESDFYQPEPYNVSTNLYIPTYLNLPIVQNVFSLASVTERQRAPPILDFTPSPTGNYF